MKVLITGATGFAGGHLARALAARGYEVRALVRDLERAEPLRASGIEPVPGDLRDPATLPPAVDGMEAVVHVAGLFREAGHGPREFEAVNVHGARALAEAAARAGVRRYVHTSTIGVHGHIPNPPARETSPFSPGDVYQRSKLAGELAVREVARDTGLPLVVVRPTSMYGPGDRRMLKLFRGVARRRFPMIGDGQALFHLVHIDDLVRGYVACLEHPCASGNVFILGGPEAVSLDTLVRITAEAAGVRPPRLHLPVWPFFAAGALCEAICVPLGLEPPLYRRRVAFFTKSRSFDISHARQVLGYEPQITLRDGVRATLDWYRAHGWL